MKPDWEMVRMYSPRAVRANTGKISGRVKRRNSVKVRTRRTLQL